MMNRHSPNWYWVVISLVGHNVVTYPSSMPTEIFHRLPQCLLPDVWLSDMHLREI